MSVSVCPWYNYVRGGRRGAALGVRSTVETHSHLQIKQWHVVNGLTFCQSIRF